MFQTVNGWTKERVIEHVKHNFRGKTLRYLDSPHFCAYRSPEGRKCAAGLFIPDELYNADMEGKPIGYVTAEHEDVIKVLPLTVTGMGNFQDVHDTLENDLPVSEQLFQLVTWLEQNVVDGVA